MNGTKALTGYKKIIRYLKNKKGGYKLELLKNHPKLIVQTHRII